ncbi:hypothetical protein P5V15_009430 [Pogonomyrmex californicus]
MNFQNVNPLNNMLNLLSGNLLPVTPNNFPIFWQIYCAIVLILQVVHLTGMFLGLTLVASKRALEDGLISIVIVIEFFIMLIYLYANKKMIIQVIQMMNDIMQSGDETMQNIANTVLKPVMVPFKLHGMISVIITFFWGIQPVTLIFEKNTFYYSDYSSPAAYSTEPFSTSIFVSSNIVIATGAVTGYLKRLSLDVYMTHLVLLLTVLYRYLAVKLAMMFQNSENYCDKNSSRMDEWAEKKLRTLCRYQKTIGRISVLVKKLLSLNFSLLYVTSVFKFCFIGIMISTVTVESFFYVILIILFTMSSLTQFFLICYAVQKLSDASTEITDEAFHEGWYQLKPSLQRIFLFLMSSNIECKVSAIEKFNLSLPSFIAIIQQSYSVCLLFLRFSWID